MGCYPKRLCRKLEKGRGDSRKKGVIILLLLPIQIFKNHPWISQTQIIPPSNGAERGIIICGQCVHANDVVKMSDVVVVVLDFSRTERVFAQSVQIKLVMLVAW